MGVPKAWAMAATYRPFAAAATRNLRSSWYWARPRASRKRKRTKDIADHSRSSLLECPLYMHMLDGLHVR